MFWNPLFKYLRERNMQIRSKQNAAGWIAGSILLGSTGHVREDQTEQRKPSLTGFVWLSFPSSLSATATFSLSGLFHPCVPSFRALILPFSYLSWCCCPFSALAQCLHRLAFSMTPVCFPMVLEPPLSRVSQPRGQFWTLKVGLNGIPN